MKSQQARTNVCGKLGFVNLYLTNTDPCQLNQSQMTSVIQNLPGLSCKQC